MDIGLSSKVVLVTGAASGIGRAVAERFAAAGSRLAIADINEDGLAELGTRLGGETLQVGLDLGDAGSCAAAVTRTVERFGRLDVLVNAGAVIIRQPLAAVTPEDVERIMRVNMAGPLFIARAAGEAMRRSGFGRIILFSSQGAHTGGYVGSTVYAMSKAAVISLTKSLAREFAGDNITVNAVAPGLVDTPMIRRDVSEEALARFMDMIPMARIAQPVELANCCLFLASDLASYVTGHTLDANGGQLMR
ncbi:SDR family NAD(P)-dependent oxidoreductase [Devosia sp.]|uniref:SDR family NAD(P)-dependent oxidoreductase n=1 Tax=Devosia sp. TaxID=1871048 RepID=UPI002EE2A3DC